MVRVINTGNSITEWRFQQADDPNEQNYLNIIIGSIALIVIGIAFGYFIYCSCCKKSKALRNNLNPTLDDVEIDPFINPVIQIEN